MKITGIEVFKVTGQYNGPTLPFAGWSASNEGVYPHPRVPAPPVAEVPLRDPGTISAHFLRIDTDENSFGLYGPIDEIGIPTILHRLRPWLLGADPLAHEEIHDRMLRHDRHGRAGYYMIGVSAVDLALWDLRGRLHKQPVYRLLGGPTRDCVQAYASMLGFSTEPVAAAATAEAYQTSGFASQKWFFSYGPGDGAEGMAHNLAMARAVREAPGPEYPLMFDATRCWTSLYAREMMARLVPLNPRWVEEPIFGDPHEVLRSLRHYRLPLASGEHIFGSTAVKDILVAGAIDILQTDVDWTGGLTESLKIAALASAFEVPLIPHGHKYASALNLIAARSPAVMPLMEYLVQLADEKQFFLKNPILCRDGYIKLPTDPGLGCDLDEKKILQWETVGS